MTTDNPVQVTRDLLHKADTDMSAFFAAFSDDCHFRLGNNAPVQGRENIQAWVADYLAGVTQICHEVLEAWSDGDTAVVRVDVTYTMHNQQIFTLPAVTRTRVHDGAVSEYLIFMDPGPVVAAS